MSSDSPLAVEAPDRDRPVFVTGGSGFVGSHLVETLRARGYREVRCLVRSRPGWLEGIAHTPVQGDLTDQEILREAMEGCSTVFHVAGRTRAQSWAALEEANVTGTVNLLDAALDLPAPPRIQITSSLAAVGSADVEVADEETPLRPVSMYGRSKAVMEERIKPYASRLGLTVIRPAAVYGPRDADIFTVLKGAARGVFPVVGASRKPALTLVHARDLVRGMVDAAEHSKTIGKTYFLGSDPPYSWDEVRDAAASALGRRVLTLRIPPGMVLPVGTAVEFMGRIIGRYPPLNREKALEIRHACIMCSSGRAHRDFGYTPAISLQDGFAEAVAWYRKAGWL